MGPARTIAPARAPRGRDSQVRGLLGHEPPGPDQRLAAGAEPPALAVDAVRDDRYHFDQRAPLRRRCTRSRRQSGPAAPGQPGWRIPARAWGACAGSSPSAPRHCAPSRSAGSAGCGCGSRPTGRACWASCSMRLRYAWWSAMADSVDIDTSARAVSDRRRRRAGRCATGSAGSDPGGANKVTAWPRWHKALVLADTCAARPPVNGSATAESDGAMTAIRRRVIGSPSQVAGPSAAVVVSGAERS